MNILERLRDIAGMNLRSGGLPAHMIDTAVEAINEITRLRAQRDDNEVRAAIGRVFQKQRDLPLCIGRRFLLDLAAEPAVFRLMAAVVYARAGGDFDRLASVERESLMCDMGAALKALAKECGE